jgi:hypothetical protein
MSHTGSGYLIDNQSQSVIDYAGAKDTGRHQKYPRSIPKASDNIRSYFSPFEVRMVFFQSNLNPIRLRL